MGRKTVFFSVGIKFTYDKTSAVERLGQQETFKSGALWSVRDGKGLSCLIVCIVVAQYVIQCILECSH
jgi:hypothetical protein